MFRSFRNVNGIYFILDSSPMYVKDFYIIRRSNAKR